MTSKEIIENIYEFDVLDKSSYYNNGLDAFARNLNYDMEKAKSLFGDFEYLERNKRSSTGDHDEVITVIHFKEHDIYIGITGYYSSSNGSEFDDICEVTPYTETITRYKIVK